MEIGIITITNGTNYGNRLQNYAMQELLSSMNLQAETIRITSSLDDDRTSIIMKTIKDCVKKLIGKSNTEFQRRQRKKRFDAFNEKYIRFSEISVAGNDNNPLLKQKYDLFICGSDQIWNAHFLLVQECLMNYLASFAEGSQRIAFAASFGANDIPSGYEDTFLTELRKFKAIGVREAAGVDLVKKYADRQDALVVLDPTLLIPKEKWMSFERKPAYITDEPFIVTYFLGGRSSQIREYIEKTARQYTAKVVNLEIEFLKDGQITDSEAYCTTPDEFVWLIHHAECVLTDSFHSSAFSIIFHRPFCVFERIAAEQNNNMGSRIDTLLNTFALTCCRDNIDNPTKRPSYYNANQVDQILQTERSKAQAFLRRAIFD